MVEVFQELLDHAQTKSGVLKGTHNLRVTAAVERDNVGLSIGDKENLAAGAPM